MVSLLELKSMSAIKARNWLTGCVDVPLLRALQAADKRVAVVQAVEGRLRALGLPLQPPDAQPDAEKRTCPHCTETKPIVSDGQNDFGLRTLPSGKQVSQPWCRVCRRTAAKRVMQ